jgi:hypothetical protein
MVCLDIKCVEGRDDTTRTSACKVLLKCLTSNKSENSLQLLQKQIDQLISIHNFLQYMTILMIKWKNCTDTMVNMLKCVIDRC